MIDTQLWNLDFIHGMSLLIYLCNLYYCDWISLALMMHHHLNLMWEGNGIKGDFFSFMDQSNFELILTNVLFGFHAGDCEEEICSAH